jgi:hypothetical protein
MKKIKYYLSILLFLAVGILKAQDKPDLLLNLSYFNNNDQVQYLLAKVKTKIDGKFQVVPNINLIFYINAEAPANLLGKAVSNEKGEAVVFITAAAKDEWMKSAKQSFIVVSEATKQFDIAKTNTDITKSKIIIDTAADRKVTAVLLELKDSVWTPVRGVDLKVAVKRFDGDLNVSETLTYTTDSLGAISADFKRDSLAGDFKGNLILTAKMEDNDLYGNVAVEKTVPWGVPTTYISAYDERTLFARRGHSPFWLELMAYSIVVAVWGVLIYLIIKIRELKKLGKMS